MKYLTKVVETYRIDNEEEAETFLQDLRSDPSFSVVKYKSTKKEIKVKSEVVDEYILFEVTKVFNDEKEPYSQVQVSYSVSNAFERI